MELSTIALIVSLVLNGLLIISITITTYFTLSANLKASDETSAKTTTIRYGDKLRISTTDLSGTPLYFHVAPGFVQGLVGSTTNDYITFIIRPVHNDLTNTDVVQMSDEFLLQSTDDTSLYVRYAYQTVSNETDPSFTQWVETLPTTYSGTSQSPENASFRFNVMSCAGALSSTPSTSEISAWFATCDITSEPLDYTKTYALSKVNNSGVLYAADVGIGVLENSMDDVSVLNASWQFIPAYN